MTVEGGLDRDEIVCLQIRGVDWVQRVMTYIQYAVEAPLRGNLANATDAHTSSARSP